MRSREVEQASNAALHCKSQLKTLKKHVEENGPSTFSQLAIIELIDSLSEATRQLCSAIDRLDNTHVGVRA